MTEEMTGKEITLNLLKDKTCDNCGHLAQPANFCGIYKNTKIERTCMYWWKTVK
jgi:hypothetical protein